MITLNYEQMVHVNAGKDGCGWAVFSLGLTLAGAFTSYATLNPVGIVLGTIGIAPAFADMVTHCGQPIVES